MFYQVTRYGEVFRPCGFLGEPAHLGLLVFALVGLENKYIIKNSLIIIITFVTLLLTGSSINLIVSVLIIIKFLSCQNKKYKKIVLIVLAIVGVCFLKGLFPQQFERYTKSFKNIEGVDGSTMIRVY